MNCFGVVSNTIAAVEVDHYKMAGAGFFVNEFNLTDSELTVSGSGITVVVINLVVVESLRLHCKGKRYPSKK